MAKTRGKDLGPQGAKPKVGQVYLVFPAIMPKNSEPVRFGQQVAADTRQYHGSDPMRYYAFKDQTGSNWYYRLPASPALVTRIGREPACDNGAPNHIILPYEEVSQEHALIKLNGIYTITDRQSSNGTKVNGIEVVAGSNRAIEGGDTITIATLEDLMKVERHVQPPGQKRGPGVYNISKDPRTGKPFK